MTTSADPVDQEHIQKTLAPLDIRLDSLGRTSIRQASLMLTSYSRSLRLNATMLFIVVSSPLLYLYKGRIVEAALKHRIPTISESTEYTRSGLLLSYGLQSGDLMQRAAEYVDKLLRGAKPADLPLQQPTKFELVINLSIAKVLGVTVPESVLLRADEVIE